MSFKVGDKVELKTPDIETKGMVFTVFLINDISCIIESKHTLSTWHNSRHQWVEESELKLYPGPVPILEIPNASWTEMPPIIIKKTKHKCHCEMRTIMISGCKCGGI